MPAKPLLATLVGCFIAFGAALAQEPLRLPDPPAKALPEGAPLVEEEVKGRPVASVAKPAHNHGGHHHAVDAAYNGYPYSGGWHAGYHHPLWDRPVALVVPPTSHYQTIWGWGVSATQIAPIYPQYEGPGFGPAFENHTHYRTTPYWPWDTRQFGVYYIRGPW